jgi:hypothetical protein
MALIEGDLDTWISNDLLSGLQNWSKSGAKTLPHILEKVNGCLSLLKGRRRPGSTTDCNTCIGMSLTDGKPKAPH